MNWRQAAIEHAKAAKDQEACGLVVVCQGSEAYFPCQNIAEDPQHMFCINPYDWVDAEDKGAIVGVFHSHVSGSPAASDVDKKFAKNMSLPWHIYSVETDSWSTHCPAVKRVQLLGREWIWRHQDCWTLVRDFYQERGLRLPDYKRPATIREFMDDPLFDRYWPECGFQELSKNDDWQFGDMLLFALNNKITHAAVYLEDQIMIHHCIGRLSSRDVMTGEDMKSLARRLRHRDFAKIQSVWVGYDANN